MKRFLCSAAVFVLLARTAMATMNLTFDMSQLGNPALSASNVFVTFAAQSSDLVFGQGTPKQESINFSSGSINIGGTSYGTSKSYSLADIATYGLKFNSAISLFVYISYGSTSGIQQLGVGSQPGIVDTAVARYSNFEVTYDGTAGGADLTNISQYGGSLRMEFLTVSGSTQSFVANTLNTGETFRRLAACSSNSSGAVLSSGSNFLRIVGPNTYPQSISGQTVQNPYPGFNHYLQSLNTASGTNSVASLTNLLSATPGGAGAYGLISSSNAVNVSATTSYNLDYHFNAYVTQVLAPSGTSNPNGTYSVLLTGYVNATPTTGGTTVVYSGLSIQIAADDLVGGNYYMKNFLYQQASNGDGISVSGSGWTALNQDFGTANAQANFFQKAAGDFAEGMLCGFVGSNTLVGGTALKIMTSAQWWQNLPGAYRIAQPGNSFYSAWGDMVGTNSQGNKNGTFFAQGGVYGSPYDDRFGLNLISPDANTTTMKITLLPDGNLTLISGTFTPLVSWLVSNGLPNTADPTSNPNHDGVPLLMDYALNLDPTQNQSASLPEPVVSGSQMSLTYFAATTGITYTVQASHDLMSWSSAGVMTSSTNISGFCTATIPLTGSKGFMRLQVTY